MIVDIVRVENGFVKYRNTFQGGPAAYFADITQPLFVAKNFLVVFQTQVGDGVLVGPIFVCRITALWAHKNAKDLSVLRRLAIFLDYHSTNLAVVLFRRLG